MSVTRKKIIGDGGSIAMLALQPHQISETADPHLPIRALLGLEGKSIGAARVGEAGNRRARGRHNDHKLARIINDQLAPAALN